MKRSLYTHLIVRIIFPALLLSLVSISTKAANVLDDFSTSSYANNASTNDGTNSWSTGWTETGPSSDNSSTAGVLQITGGRLQMRGVFGTDPFIQRSVDLSGIPAGPVTVSYDIASSGNFTGIDRYSTSIGRSATGPWRRLVSRRDDINTTDTFTLQANEITNETTIRFHIDLYVFNPLLLFIDNVAITFPDPILPPPTISKNFSPAFITAGETTQLTLTLNNNTTSSLANISLTDDMPKAMWLDSLTIGGTCTGFTFNASTKQGDSSFTVINGNMSANETCTLTFEVMSNVPGSHTNTANGAEVNDNGIIGTPSNGATLTVADSLTAVCTPSNLGDGAIFFSVDENIYSLDLASAKATLITTSPFASDINSLAYSPEKYLLYYTDKEDGDAANTALRAFDVLTGSHITLENNLAQYGFIVDEAVHWAKAGAFYHGSIYLGIQESDEAYRLVLSDDGRSARYSTKLFDLPNSHFFGDFVAAHGKLYSFDRGDSRFRTYDLATLALEQNIANFAIQGGARRNGDSIWSVGFNLGLMDLATGTVDPAYDTPITIDGNSFLIDEPDDAAGCIPTTSRISGLIWLDENADSTRNNTELAIGGVSLSLIWDLNGDGILQPSETDIRKTSTTTSDGYYHFDHLVPGDYIVRVTDTNNVLNGLTPTNNTSNDYAISLGLTSELNNIDFGYQSFITVRGSVFNDNGPNGVGEAYNGLVDINENGFKNIVVEARDPNNANALIDSTVTESNGNYTLTLPNSVANTPITIRTSTLSGYISVSESISTTGATNPNTQDDSITFTPTASGVYTDVNFGDVLLLTIRPENTQAIRPNTAATYAHQVKVGSSGNLSFSLANYPLPSNTDWPTSLYQDTNCDYQLSTVELSTQSISPSDTISVVANDVICIIFKISAPSDVPPSSQHMAEITAHFEYLGETPDGLTSQAITRDLTKITSTGLELTKSVENLSTGSPESTRNTAYPGQTLRYKLIYRNNSAEAITEMLIKDSTPAYASLTAPITCPALLPLGLTGCTIISPTTTNNIIGFEGALEWSFAGELAAGEEGEVSFNVIIK